MLEQVVRGEAKADIVSWLAKIVANSLAHSLHL